MPEIWPERQRDFAVEVVRRLHAAGFEAYWAGGCVRDRLLGRVPQDYDVATSARPEQIRQLFGHRRTLAIGAAFGVICVLGPPHAGQVEVTTFRTDVNYQDGRRPETVHFSTAEEDAKRRDFTINGMFFDPIQGRILDFVHGHRDLDNRRLCAIGDPHERFTEDKLRMLRAVRFAATFEFTLDAATFAAIQKMASEITVVSVERIADEVSRMLEHPQRALAAEMLRTSGLLAAILPEALPLLDQRPPDGVTAESAWEYTRAVLAILDEPDFPEALAALLHALPQAATFAPVLGRRWKLAVKEIERTQWLLENLRSLENAAQIPWPKLQRILIHEESRELIALHTARAKVGAAHLADAAYCHERLQLPPNELNPPPLITGDDLITLGIPRGAIFKTLLDAVRDAQLENRVTTKTAALELARELAAR